MSKLVFIMRASQRHTALFFMMEGILHTLALCFGHNDLTEKTSPNTQPVGVVGVRRVQSKAHCKLKLTLL